MLAIRGEPKYRVRLICAHVRAHRIRDYIRGVLAVGRQVMRRRAVWRCNVAVRPLEGHPADAALKLRRFAVVDDVDPSPASRAGGQEQASPEGRYCVRRLDARGRTIQTHDIVAMDGDEAVELAHALSGTGRAQLWHGDKLIHEIEPFAFRRRPGVT